MSVNTNVLFIVFAGIGALLAVVPLPKAIASGNVGTSMLILWTECACLVLLANAIRWNGNIGNWDPAWCDFCSHFLVAVDVALAGAGVSINRRLYMIVTLDPRRFEKVYNAIVDSLFCLVIPLVSIALEYIVQQYRYYIYEDIGCGSGIASVDLSFPLVWMVPLMVGIVSAVYAYLTIRASLHRNHKVMGESGTSATWGRRLMAIGIISAIYGLVPTSISVASLAAAFPVTSWPGWDAIHSTIGEVIYVPAQEWQSTAISIAATELRRWTIVSLTFVVFGILGLTEDVKKMYRMPFRSVPGHVFSTNQTSTIVIGRNGDENLNVHQQDIRSSHLHCNHSCITFEKPLEGGRGESFELTDRSRTDVDVEAFSEHSLSPSSPPAFSVETVSSKDPLVYEQPIAF